MVEDREEELVAKVTENLPILHVEMIIELYMVTETTTKKSWLDSGATIHVCNNKQKLKKYKYIVEGWEVLMGSSNA